jgi:tyrosyl-tRNA synthetase
LFGSSFDEFKKLTGSEIEDAFDSSLTFQVHQSLFDNPVDAVGLLGEKTSIYSSKGEARKAIQGNGVSINKKKITMDRRLTKDDLLYGKYLLAQKGKKNYYLIVVQ